MWLCGVAGVAGIERHCQPGKPGQSGWAESGCRPCREPGHSCCRLAGPGPGTGRSLFSRLPTSLRARRSPVPAPEPRSVPPPPGALDTRERELVSVEGDASSPSDGAGEAVPCGPEGGGRGCGLNATPGTLCVSPGPCHATPHAAPGLSVPAKLWRGTSPWASTHRLVDCGAPQQDGAPSLLPLCAAGVDDHGGGEEDQHDPGGHSGKGVLNARDGARRAVRVDRHLRIRRGRDGGGGSEGFVGDRRARADTDGRGSWGSGESG